MAAAMNAMKIKTPRNAIGRPAKGRIGFAACWLAVAFAAATPGLGGCAKTAVGTGAVVGVAAYEERGVEVAASDLKMTARLKAKMIDLDPAIAVKVGVEIHEGRILLTGMVINEKTRADAVGLAWQTPGVKEVYNEIQTGKGGVMDLALDSLITTRIKSKITFDKKIMAINYAIETVDGTVYLIGIAQDKTELERVIAHARNVAYVRKIISHVRMKETP